VLNGSYSAREIDPALVDDVIWGCVMQAGEQALDIAANRGARGGLAGKRSRRDRHRQCGSSQQSVHFAAAGSLRAI